MKANSDRSPRRTGEGQHEPDAGFAPPAIKPDADLASAEEPLIGQSMQREEAMHGDNGIHSGTTSTVRVEPEIQVTTESERTTHPDYLPTRPVRVRIVLISGIRCIGDLHVKFPDGRVSDVLNDDRDFTPMTAVVIEGDATQYDFLTVNKSQIAMIYEIRRD
jgi:Family of unknown function (DUF6812)